MDTVIKVCTVVLVSAIFSGCGNSGSSSSDSSSKTAEDCRGEVERAIRNAGSDEVAMMRAGDRALKECMER